MQKGVSNRKMAKGTKNHSSAADLREPEIKAALIDALFAEGMICDDTVIVSEMPVFSMSRRADIVMANGRLIGFEIKSDGDKTSRLSGQLAAYQEAFEGIVVVTGAKHLEECLKSTPETVGLVAIDQIENSLPIARLVRKPFLRMMSTEEAITQMRADELYKLTRQVKANPTRSRDRFTLESIVRGLPARIVRNAALDAIKSRYRAPYEAFFAARAKNCSTLSALTHLRRPMAHRGASPRVDPNAICAELEKSELSTLSLCVRPRRRS